MNRLTQAVYPGTWGAWSWTYDPVGNRTQQVAPTGVTTYTYDVNNRLNSAGTSNYTYDSNGNLTGVSTGQTFTYDVFNQMTQAMGPGGTATYAYNGAGLKTQRNGPDGITRYYYDGIRSVWETDGAGAVTAQLDWDIFGNLLDRQDTTGRRYYHPDGLGSTVALTNESGVVSASMLYDAWGNLRAAGGTAPGKYQFTGAELDSTTGLYHMGARFYDPTVGRWLSEDPVQNQSFNPLSLNFYAYVLGNPTRLTDPTGLDALDPGIGGGPTMIEQVMKWMERGEEYAKDQLHRLYDAMAYVYEQNALATQKMNTLLVLSLAMQAFIYKGMEYGSPGMPAPGSPLGQLVTDVGQSPGGWRIIGTSTEGATGARYVGGTSTRLIFMRLRDGASFGYHMIAKEGQILHQHFVGGSAVEIWEWFFK